MTGNSDKQLVFGANASGDFHVVSGRGVSGVSPLWYKATMAVWFLLNSPSKVKALAQIRSVCSQWGFVPVDRPDRVSYLDTEADLFLSVEVGSRQAIRIVLEATAGRFHLPFSQRHARLLVHILAATGAGALRFCGREEVAALSTREARAELSRLDAFQLDADGLVLPAPRSEWLADYLLGQGRDVCIRRGEHGAMIVEGRFVGETPRDQSLSVEAEPNFSPRRWLEAISWLAPDEPFWEEWAPLPRGVRRWWLSETLDEEHLPELDRALSGHGYVPVPGPGNLAELVLPILRGWARTTWSEPLRASLQTRALHLVQSDPGKASLDDALHFAWHVAGLRRYRNPNGHAEALFHQIDGTAALFLSHDVLDASAAHSSEAMRGVTELVKLLDAAVKVGDGVHFPTLVLPIAHLP